MNSRLMVVKSKAWNRIHCAFLFSAFALHLPAQSATDNGAHTLIVSSGQPTLLLATPSSSFGPGNLYREIDDLHTGDRWLLYRDGNNPAGPGRLVLAGKTATASASNSANKPSLPVIHRGDSLIVTEDSAAVSGQLEAVALEPATEGSSLTVRLKLGGRTYRAVATGPGRARFAEDQGAQ